MSTQSSQALVLIADRDSVDDFSPGSRRRTRTVARSTPERKRRSGYQAWFGFPPARSTQRLGSGPFQPVSRLTRVRSLRTWSKPALTAQVRVAPPEPPRMSPHPFPHLPEGLELESEDSLRALATMVVAYHGTVPPELQAEFIRLLMKYAGETAGTLIRQQMHP